MKAFVLEKYGAPIREVSMPEPAPGPRQVLVRMAASGVNHADERTRAGEFKAVFQLALPQVMGGELSGEVVAVGEQVTEFTVGDEVYAYTGVVAMGTFAEAVAVDADALAPTPASIDPVAAASLPVVALTAWQALVEIGHLQPGQRVLVHGGSGGVGSVVIQLAKHLGATVVTTASAANADFVRELGADEVIDYRTEDFVARLSGNPVDLVLDTQGGDTTKESLKVLNPGGIVIGIAGTPDPHLADQAGAGKLVKLALAALSLPLRRQARKLGVTYRFLFIHPDGQALRTIAALVDQGVLRPVVDRVLPFDQTPEALRQVLAGGTRGKVVVTTQPYPDNPASADSAITNPDKPSRVPESQLSQRSMTWVATPTRRLAVGGGSVAFRDLGPTGGTPVVLLTHLGATLDEWDPRVVDALARQHRVVALGALPGAGASTGSASIKGMADTVRALVAALGMDRIDLFGFSLGGFVAQQVALDAPELVRRLVLTGTGPAGGKGIDRVTGAAYVNRDMLCARFARTDPKEFLFFPRTPAGKAAAKDYLGRIGERLMDRDAPIRMAAFRRQIRAIQAWGRQQPQDLSKITAPTLIANGDHDRMVPTPLSEDLNRRIPDSSLVIYPEAGHGGVFQYHHDFTASLLTHLDS
ncbi:MAG: alpha/beta fold hydrolase [Propionicimonas sp.]